MVEMDRLGATRFVAGGPALPDRLLADQLRGDVLFICGAGVSMTAGLPSFRDLARKVYGTLGQDWTGHAPEAGAMAENGPYSGQYDRMFRSLERRVAASDTREAPGMRRRLLEAVASHLRIAVGAALPNHEALLALSSGKVGVARLLTTNFDMLFERAGDGGGERIESHAGPSMPRPGTCAFEGVLHIHGRIGDDEDGKPASDLVLSSADFGEAYLRSGWAARYVYDLSRAFTLVLVGYAADDPPMRYLMEVLEADRARYDDLKPVYAFAPTKSGLESETRELWLSKGIEPVPYVLSPDDRHEALYSTLRAWRDFADAPTAWRGRRLAEIASGPSSISSTADVAEVASLLSHGDAWQLLLESTLPSDWWGVLHAHPAFEGRAEMLGAWIGSRLSDRTMLASCALHPPRRAETLERIRAALWSGSQRLDAGVGRCWRLLSNGSPDPTTIGSGWPAIVAQVSRGHMDPILREGAVGILRPAAVVTAAAAYQADCSPSAWRAIDFRACEEVSYRDVLACWPDDPGETWSLLRAADRALSAALDEASDLGWFEGFDRSSYDVHSVSSDDGGKLEQRFFNLTRLVAVLWDRFALSDGARAAETARSWAAGPQILKRRLYLHALACPAAFGGDEVGRALALLADQELWVEDTRREVRRLSIARWAHLTGDIRGALEVRLAAGPPVGLRRDPSGTEAGWRSIVDHMVSEALGALRDAGCELGQVAKDALHAADHRTDADVAAPALEATASADAGTVVGLPSSHGIAASDAELLAEAMKPRAPDQLRWMGPWYDLCQDEPRRALEALELSAAEGGEWSSEGLEAFLRATENAGEPELRWRTAELLASIPIAARVRHAQAVAWWLSTNASGLVGTAGLDWERFASLWRAFAHGALAAGDSPGMDLGPDPRMASNMSTVGLLAKALISALRRRSALGVAMVDDSARSMLDALLEAGGLLGLHARMQLASEIAFLDLIAPRWCLDRLAPLLDPSAAEASALWLARADGGPTGPIFFNRTKVGFMWAISTCTGPADNARGLAGLLVDAVLAACEPESLIGLRSAEVKAALAASTPDLRHWVAWRFCLLVAQDGGTAADRAERWRTRVRLAFEFSWPPDASARQPASLRDLARLPFECGDAFAEAVDAVADMLAPFEVRSIDALFFIGDASKRAAADMHPSAFLELLSLVVDQSMIPHDLVPVLERMVAADPSLRRLRAYRALQVLYRS